MSGEVLGATSRRSALHPTFLDFWSGDDLLATNITVSLSIGRNSYALKYYQL